MACHGSKAKIMQAARELFYLVGIQATSVDDILRRSGVSKSNFYYHFPSKEQLAFAVLDAQIVEQESLLLHALDPGRSPSARLQAFCQEVCRLQREVRRMNGCPFGNMAASLAHEGDPHSERLRERLSEVFRDMETALCHCLTEGVQSGEFRADVPPGEQAAFFLAAIEGLMILTKTYRDDTRLENGMRLAQRLLRAT